MGRRLNLGAAISGGGPTPRSYTVTGNLIGGQADTTLTQGFSGGGGSVTATCTPAPAPTVTGISPASGPAGGGTITGTGFTGVTAVKFGSAASSFTVNGTTSITATSPAGSGPVDVTVTTAAGTSATSAADRFTYPGGSSSVTLASSANPSQAGQAVTFTATSTGPGGTPTGTITFRDGGVTLGTVALAGGTASVTTAALSVGTHAITASYSGDPSFPAATSAVLQQAVSVPTDSLKARAPLIVASNLVATNSGAAITGAVDGAINDAFNGGGNPVTVGPNGVALNFAAEPRSDVQQRTDAAFAALGYAGEGGGLATKAPPRGPAVARDWSLWADIHGTGFDSSSPNADLRGSQPAWAASSRRTSWSASSGATSTSTTTWPRSPARSRATAAPSAAMPPEHRL
jgi:hypothetical protein